MDEQQQTVLRRKKKLLTELFSFYNEQHVRDFRTYGLLKKFMLEEINVSFSCFFGPHQLTQDFTKSGKNFKMRKIRFFSLGSYHFLLVGGGRLSVIASIFYQVLPKKNYQCDKSERYLMSGHLRVPM